MKKRVLFIINPVSGVGRQKTVEKLIDRELDRSCYEPEIAYTQSRGHATELATAAVQRNVEIIVAVGGDGSVNEVGQALIHTPSVLGILPAGSGNGLARHLCIPMDLSRAMERIMNGKIIKMDTGILNDKVFLGMSGVGFDAHIGWEFARFGKRGFSSYIKVFLREFPKYKAGEYKIEIDGRSFIKNALLISVANGSQYGNNAFIAPQADVSDGLLDICILSEFPVYAAPFLARRLFNRSLDRSKYLEILKGKDIRITQPDKTAHIDGEPLEEGRDLHFKIVPSSLNVIC